MSVRSFHSVFMVTVVAGAALGCYLVSLRVASERSALDQVERQIVQTQYDIRLLQTEIGTRGRLAQLERWNVRVLELSAPSADQILGDKFQLARLITPQTKPALDAPVILATAPSPEPDAQPGDSPEARASATGEILHRASLKVAPSGEAEAPAAKKPEQSRPARPEPARSEPAKPRDPGETRKAGDIAAKTAVAQAKPPARTARRPAIRPTPSAGTIDPLAPLASGDPAIEGSRTDR